MRVDVHLRIHVACVEGHPSPLEASISRPRDAAGGYRRDGETSLRRMMSGGETMTNLFATHSVTIHDA